MTANVPASLVLVLALAFAFVVSAAFEQLETKAASRTIAIIRNFFVTLLSSLAKGFQSK